MKDQSIPESWKQFAKKDGEGPSDLIDLGPVPPVKTLVMKLAEVMAAVERVPKRGHNQHFNYDFATESDITVAIRSQMAARSLMLFPDVQSVSWREAHTKNGIQTIACLMVKFTIRDGETGEEFSFQVPGEGADSGDKCIPKAMTSALKYALLKLYLIPTGDDPEIDSKGEKQTVKRTVPSVRPSAPPVTTPASAPRAPYVPPGINPTTGEEVDAPDGLTWVHDYQKDGPFHVAFLSKGPGDPLQKVKTKHECGKLLEVACTNKMPARVTVKGLYVENVEVPGHDLVF